MTKTDFIAVFPELALFIWVCVLLVGDLFAKDRRFIHYGSLLGLTCLAILSVGYFNDASSISAFGHSFVSDALAHLLKIAAYLATAITFVLSRQYLEDRGLLKGEFYGLALCALLGQMIMISSSWVRNSKHFSVKFRCLLSFALKKPKHLSLLLMLLISLSKSTICS